MPRKERIWYPHAIYHVMNRGVRKTPLFTEAAEYNTFYRILLKAQEKYGFKLHAYCLMKNHYHLLIETQNEELWKIMKDINQVYAQNFNYRHATRGHVFEARYHAILIKDESYFLEVSRYIHQNPVKANIVNSPEEYPYSSYRAYIGQTYDFLTDTSYLHSIFGQKDGYRNLRFFMEKKRDNEEQTEIIKKDIGEENDA